MQELIRRIGGVRPCVDDGLLRVGPRLDKASRREALLLGGASRSLSLADAVVQLCRQDHINEALPIVRELAETALVMTIASDEESAAKALSQWTNSRWENLWPEMPLAVRWEAAGLPAKIGIEVDGLCRQFTNANRAVIPWSHIYEENTMPGADPAAVLTLSARLLAAMLRALRLHWPEAFLAEEDLEK